MAWTWVPASIISILAGAQILTRSGRCGPVVLAACAVSLARGMLLGLQLVPRPALNAVAPAIEAIEPSNRNPICVGWRRALKHRALAQRAEKACPWRISRPHLQARFSVLGQMPSRSAACFSPSPKCSCSSSRLKRAPGLPALPPAPLTIRVACSVVAADASSVLGVIRVLGVRACGTASWRVDTHGQAVSIQGAPAALRL